MKILITGAVGFIGFHLSNRLLNLGHYVVGIDSMNDYYDVSLKNSRLKILQKNANFAFHKIDLNDVNNCIKEKNIDIVFNLAAQAGVRLGINDNYKYINSNVSGFNSILNFCVENQIQDLIYASSSSVYSGNTKVPYSESDTLEDPKSFYAATKINNEQLASIYSDKFDMNCIGHRFFTVYGPYGRPDMAYFSFCKKLLNKEKITIFNNGDTSRDMTYIDDIIDGIILSMDRRSHELVKNQVFNLGNKNPIKTLHLLDLIEEHFNQEAEIIFVDSKNEVAQTFADLTKSKNLLSYDPKINIEKGMKSFFEWFNSYYKN